MSNNLSRTKWKPLDSCADLLKHNTYRAFLWLFSLMSISGNLGSFITRMLVDKKRLTSFSVFVTSLCLADLLMGVYLAIVGVVDMVYQGQYVLHDVAWKNSPLCTVAGVLSLVSSEVSAFNICLITLDRFLVMRFPLRQVSLCVMYRGRALQKDKVECIKEREGMRKTMIGVK